MTTKTYTVRITGVNTEAAAMDCAGMALLYGVTAEEIRALVTGTTAAIPDEWIKRSRQRHKEAAAASGSEDIDDCLAYWARKDHDAALVLDVT
jgi:hypothetical protein